jgi:hypothetical protein
MKIFAALLIFLISMQMASSVGIKWVTEGIRMPENSEKCVTYYAYNPSDNDIKVHVDVTGPLKEVLTSLNQEDMLIKANTPPDQSVRVDFCFKSKKVYNKDCLIGNLLCEQQCGQETKVYSGEVVLTEAYAGGSGTGSGASISASAPLSVQVDCTPYERSWASVYILSIIIVLILLVVLFYKKYSTPKVIRDEEKLKRLQEKVKIEKGKK